jgi:hypothetical protein
MGHWAIALTLKIIMFFSFAACCAWLCVVYKSDGWLRYFEYCASQCGTQSNTYHLGVVRPFLMLEACVLLCY